MPKARCMRRAMRCPMLPSPIRPKVWLRRLCDWAVARAWQVRKVDGDGDGVVDDDREVADVMQ